MVTASAIIMVFFAILGALFFYISTRHPYIFLGGLIGCILILIGAIDLFRPKSKSRIQMVERLRTHPGFKKFLSVALVFLCFAALIFLIKIIGI